MELKKLPRFIFCKKALESLERVINRYKKTRDHEFALELQDSMIQRFEYSIDIFYKLLQDILIREYGIKDGTIPGPRKTAQQAFAYHILTAQEYEIMLEMIEARNNTSHGYVEELAAEIAAQIPRYCTVMLVIYMRFDSKDAL